MEVHNSTTHFSYRIEQKPGGGFLARSDDPDLETLEGATKEEIIQKLQAKALSATGVNLGGGLSIGGLKINVTRKVNVTTSALAGETTQEKLPQETNQGFSSPIERSSDTTGTTLRILAAAVALAALTYFLLHR